MTGKSEKNFECGKSQWSEQNLKIAETVNNHRSPTVYWQKRTFREIIDCSWADDLRKAEKTWIIHAQEDLSDDALYWFRRLGLIRTSYGIITVSQRMNKWIGNNWHPPSFALIPSRHPFAEFIFKAVHDRDYAGIDDTLAKILSIFFIPMVK